MSHIAAAHWVDGLGLVVGTLGVCIAIYLTMVSPYKHSLDARLGFLFLGTAILLMSNEPLLTAHIIVLTSRVIALVVLMLLQLVLAIRVVYFGPFPLPREAIEHHLVKEGVIEEDEDTDPRTMREMAQEAWPPDNGNSDDEPP